MSRKPTRGPSLLQIQRASRRIEGVASRTPLVRSPSLSKRFGVEVHLKLECFQPIRVFKIRGAYNRTSMTKERRVVAASSGNHGIAVSYSCMLLGKRCTVVVPEGAVKEKVQMIEEYGAEVVTSQGYQSLRDAKARELVRKTGAAFVHPFDDPEVIAGQGTCGLEIVEQIDKPDAVVVPVGGGGLISGIATAVKGLSPRTRVFGVEPVGARKLQAAIANGKPVKIESPTSIADGLIPQSVSRLTFETCLRYVDGVTAVSDEQIMEAMRILMTDAHIFPEPSGAASVAALLDAKDMRPFGRRVVLVISGGNVSQELLRNVLSQKGS